MCAVYELLVSAPNRPMRTSWHPIEAEEIQSFRADESEGE